MSPPSSGSERIAFFGGSFDPPHLGHIAVAHAAQQALALDKVLFAPVGLQPLKPSGSSASFQHRAAMTQVAIAAQPGFELSMIDAPLKNEDPKNVERTHASSSAPNFTVDTLTRLRNSLAREAQLFLLLGADSFRTFHYWHRAAEIPFLASLIIASRPGEYIDNLAACLPPDIAIRPLPDQPNRYTLTNPAGDQSQLLLLPNLNYDISATQLRNQIQRPPVTRQTNEPPMLDPAVLAYIHQHHLYE